MVRRQEVEGALANLMAGEKIDRDLGSRDEYKEETDHAAREMSKQTFYSLLERKHRDLKRIKTLVVRLEQDEEFGICEDCGKRIPEARLLILPEATRCVPCQQEEERFESRKSTLERARNASRDRKQSRWEDDSDNEEVGISVKVDTDGLSFSDLEETELAKEEKGKE